MMITIKQKLKINSKYFLDIIRILNSSGAKVRVVGGVVRDALLDIDASDIDIATDFLPERVMQILVQNKIKVIPTGIKFGTVTAVLEGESFEITTLRKDFDCDGRHASIEYSTDFAEDAARRDFTINALSYCPIKQVIYDYFGGIKDLEARRVVFIGDAKQRIREDYLRILRFFRFSCRYAKVIDDKGLAACIANKDGLDILSRERIKSEMDLLLPLPNSPQILDKMWKSGILELILPVKKYDEQFHVRALEISDSFGVKLELEVIYAMLFTSIEDISLNQLLELKFSKAEARLIMQMLKLGATDDVSIIVDRLKVIWLEDKKYLLYFVYILLIVDDDRLIRQLYDKLSKLELPVFPIKGDDLLKLGYSGEEIGKNLDFIKSQWIKSDFTLDRTQLINLVKKSEK